MTWLMKGLKIQIEEILIKYNPKYDGYQRELASMVYKYFDKKTPSSGIKMKKFLTKNQLKNYTNQLLENFIKEKHTHLLLRIFWVQTQQICN